MNFKKFDAITLIGIAGSALAFIGQLVSSHANDKKTDVTITEKVADEVAKQLKNR